MGPMKAPFFFIRRAVFLLAVLPLLAVAQNFPPQISAALKSAGIPEGRFGVVVWEAGKAEPAFTHQAQSAFNPASVMKLLTTYAGLEILGPAYAWKTEAYADGPVVNGKLAGNLYIRGYGDPTLTL